jgi:hypothetical protein
VFPGAIEAAGLSLCARQEHMPAGQWEHNSAYDFDDLPFGSTN